MTDGALAAGAELAAKSAGNLLSRCFRRYRPDTSPEALNKLANNLAAAVRRRETVLRDQLRGGPDKIIDTAGFEDVSRFRATGDIHTQSVSAIGEFFRQHAPQQRLAVLGEPGAGKTVLLITLLLDQLKYRAESTTPVPVRVNAAGWDGSGELGAWLADRIAVAYGLHARQAQALLDEGRILPFLDGLDECDPLGDRPERSSAILGALNEVPWTNRGVVVACRTDVFNDIQELRGDAGLHGAATITLQPVLPAEISAYLIRYRAQRGLAYDDWAPVIDQINCDPDGPLATALRTHWLLGLAAAGLHRRSYTGAQLAACADTAAVDDLLFAALLPEAINASPGARKWGYTEENAGAWMRTLADELERRLGAGQPAEIRLDQLWTIGGRRRVSIISGLLCGLPFGLALLFGWKIGLPESMLYSLAAGLIGALLAGAGPGLSRAAPGLSSPSRRLAWRVPGRSRWSDGLVIGLGGLAVGLLMTGGLAGLMAGLTVLFGFGLEHEVGIAWWLGGLPVVLAIVPVFALYTTFDTTPDDRLALGQEAHRVIRDDRTAGMVFGLAFGLACGLAEGLKYGLAEGLVSGLSLLPLGLLIFGGGAASALYAAACLVFRFTGQFPARPARFLEWGRNTGLLRVTDIAYQFRHETYRRWLRDR